MTAREVIAYMELLRDFLRQHVHEMPRTTLRYAIKKMSDEERQAWMHVDVDNAGHDVDK